MSHIYVDIIDSSVRCDHCGITEKIKMPSKFEATKRQLYKFATRHEKCVKND